MSERRITIPPLQSERTPDRPTEYAGKNPEYAMGQLVVTDIGREVKIVVYDIHNGLYHVEETERPERPYTERVFKIHPDKLKPKE